MNDIENRLAMLEAILGIDETAAMNCVHNPEHCVGCTPEICPYQTNKINQIGNEQERNRAEILFLRSIIDEIISSGILPSEILIRARARASLVRMEQQLSEIVKTRQQMESLGSSGSILASLLMREQELTKSIEKAREKLTQIHRAQ